MSHSRPPAGSRNALARLAWPGPDSTAANLWACIAICAAVIALAIAAEFTSEGIAGNIASALVGLYFLVIAIRAAGALRHRSS